MPVWGSEGAGELTGTCRLCRPGMVPAVLLLLDDDDDDDDDPGASEAVFLAAASLDGCSLRRKGCGLAGMG